MKSLGKPEPDSDVINTEPGILLIGYGWVGQYLGKYFTNAHYVESDGVVKEVSGDTLKADYDTYYDLAIISVPTPMNPETGECDTSIVEEAVQKYKDRVGGFLIKSTVSIGTTDYLKEKYNVRIAMSPEYIGETLGHPLLEPKRDAFLILGGEDETVKLIADMFKTVLHANAPIMLCTAKEAEIIKYKENEYLMRLVDFWNDVEKTCATFNQSFDRVREGLVLDPRVNRTHSFVYKNNRGWSGKCLPKDMNALAHTMRAEEQPLETLEHLIEKNVKVRKHYKDKNKLIPDKPLWKK